jgi:NitT/TauT family transport system substrate-binding protein
MRRREILRSSALFSIGAVSAALLASCNNQAGQSPSGKSDAAKKPLRVGTIPWTGWSALHIAEQKQFFQTEGIEVQQTTFATVSEVNTALLSGQIDLAWLVAADLLVLTEKMPDLKYIYASDYSGDVDAIVGYGINSAADLKGKKLAREDVPYELVFTGNYLDASLLTEKDVEIVSLPVPDATDAFIAGKVDVVVTYEPFIAKALKERPGSTVLYSAKGTNVIPNGLAGAAATLQSRREDVLAYLRAYAKGMAFTQANVAEAHGIIAKWVGVEPAVVAEQMGRIKVLDMAANKSIVFNANDPLNVVKSIDSAGPILARVGKIAQALPGSSLIDSSFMKAM